MSAVRYSQVQRGMRMVSRKQEVMMWLYRWESGPYQRLARCSVSISRALHTKPSGRLAQSIMEIELWSLQYTRQAMSLQVARARVNKLEEQTHSYGSYRQHCFTPLRNSGWNWASQIIHCHCNAENYMAVIGLECPSIAGNSTDHHRIANSGFRPADIVDPVSLVSKQRPLRPVPLECWAFLDWLQLAKLFRVNTFCLSKNLWKKYQSSRKRDIKG